MKRYSGWVFWLAIAAGIAVMVFGIIFVRRIGSDITLSATPLADKPVPDVAVDYLDSDGQFRLTDFNGQIVVLNFWASWCFECRAEHEALLTAAAGYAGPEVAFVGVAYLDDADDSDAFLDALGRSDKFTYGIDEGSRFAVEFGVSGVPETFFIDADGIVRGKVTGPVSVAVLQNTLDALLLGQSIDPQVVTGEVQDR